jgi:hypothetical protein
MTDKRWEAKAISGIFVQTSKGIWWDKIHSYGRDKNWFADTLATLASTIKIDFKNIVQPINIEVGNSLAHYYSVKEEMDKNLWYYDIKQFIQH